MMQRQQDTVFPAPRRPRRNATIFITPERAPPTTITTTTVTAPPPARPNTHSAPSTAARRRVRRPLQRRVAQLRAGHDGAEAPMRSTGEERRRAVRTEWEPIEADEEVETESEMHIREGEGREIVVRETNRGGCAGRRWGWVGRVFRWVFGRQ
ncbi:hypothetical protein EDC01DRAFT_633020 [Geopyxis carbonaria]|nr:hypothetical protein EDC01DRAFT_633020 [Geopyxis carbonaria]